MRFCSLVNIFGLKDKYSRDVVFNFRAFLGLNCTITSANKDFMELLQALLLNSQNQSQIRSKLRKVNRLKTGTNEYQSFNSALHTFLSADLEWITVYSQPWREWVCLSWIWNWNHVCGCSPLPQEGCNLDKEKKRRFSFRAVVSNTDWIRKSESILTIFGLHTLILSFSLQT